MLAGGCEHIHHEVRKMNMAVVPAKNEEGRIGKVLTLLRETLVDKIIVVINGSCDNTMREVKEQRMENVEVLYFTPELALTFPGQWEHITLTKREPIARCL